MPRYFEDELDDMEKNEVRAVDNTDVNKELDETLIENEDAQFSPLGIVRSLYKSGYSALEAATQIKSCYEPKEAKTYLSKFKIVYGCSAPDVSHIKCKRPHATPNNLVSWQKTQARKGRPFKGEKSPYWDWVNNGSSKTFNNDGNVNEPIQANPDGLGMCDNYDLDDDKIY